jgi:type I restriction enzyme M protein
MPDKSKQPKKLKKRKFNITKKINIDEIIKNNETLLDDINQMLHNEGVVFDKRIDIITAILNQKINGVNSVNGVNDVNIDEKIATYIKNKFSKNILSNEEIIQKIFMFYGNKLLKKNLDQFYTPLTIGKFICGLCNENKKVIDPACGTGDLAVFYKQNITLWDISNEVISLTNLNYKFHSINATIEELDSIKNYSKDNGIYDYVFLNPPFGSKTVITDTSILNHYELGKDLKKQEMGILFIERSLNLLKDNGVGFIIVPAGYLGNSANNFVNLRKYLLKYRIISVLKLPQNCFARSGTGVSTYLLVINKVITSEPYDIFIKDIVNIGYELHKKNTPIKYKKNSDKYILNDKGFPIVHNDLENILDELKYFCHVNNIDCLKANETVCDYEHVNTSKLEANKYILDIGRYLSNYKETINSFTDNTRVKDFLQPEYNLKFVKDNTQEYTYLDIKEVSTPFYNGKKLYGYELPGRAAYNVKKHDILVSKLKGNISFTIVLNDEPNIICTNGFSVLRPKSHDDMIIIFGNLFNDNFKIQHYALTTGSIMETISDDDIKNILISTDINKKKYEMIIDSLTVIKNELS